MGLDRSIPYYAVNMVCSAPDCAPRDAALPAGYTFAGYQDGMEDAWASILLGTDMAGSREGALECFQEFRENLPLTRERMLFVRDASGEPIATATLWQVSGKANPRHGYTGWACCPSMKARALPKRCFRVCSVGMMNWASKGAYFS